MGEEDVFELFEGSPHSFSVTVGRRLSRASFFLDEEEVLPTLQTLAAVTNEAVGTPVSSAQTLPRTSSLDLGASRMPDSPPTLTASFRPVDSPTIRACRRPHWSPPPAFGASATPLLRPEKMK